MNAEVDELIEDINGLADAAKQVFPPSRELSLVLTKLQEAALWASLLEA